ncbi:MAG: hypothetical protein WEE67_06040 [Chloroflexota bacterium]
MSAERSVLRLEAALYEVGRTVTYPAMPDPTAAILAAVAERKARLAWPAVRVGRPLLVAILIVLVLAGVAVAYIAIQGWLSTGPRGIQFSDEFAFAEVYRDGGLPVEPGPLPPSVYYADFAISHDGSAIYAVRMPTHPERAATLVRLTGLDEPTLQREEVLDYAALTDPALWDPGFDASAVDIGILLFNSDDDTFAVAPDGQLFLAAGAYGRDRIRLPYAEEREAELRANWPDITDAEIDQVTTRQPIVSAALIVLRADGSRQKVLTIAELVAAGLFTTDGAEASIAVAASAADRLWVKSHPFGDASAPPSLFQVIDPDRDGDWSNRVVLPLALPDSIPPPAAIPRPGDEPRESWHYRQPTAEISTSHVDRSRSVLLPMLSSTGEYRIYRVSDTNADGDARDGGESQLVLSGQPGFGDSKWPTVTSRVVIDGGNEVLRELLVSSLTRSTRLSRVLEDGSVRDIARAIDFGPEDVVAEPDGDIDIVVQGSRGEGTGPVFTIYRLTPVPIGEAGASASPGEASPSPSSSAGGLETLTAGEPRIVYTLESFSEEETAQIMVVGADGSGPTVLIPGEHNSYFCQSADGSLIGFWSDEEVPHESFVYVANADGTGRRKISEDVGVFWCGFSGDAILIKGRAESAPILRHDLATGEETELLRGADQLQASPDGRRYLAAIGGADGSTLEALDAARGDRRVLDGPLPENRTFTSFAWAPDGALVAYAIGPAPTAQGPQTGGPHEIYVVDPAGGQPRLVYSLDAYEPRLAFSADARHLLVRAPSPETGQGPLVLVEVKTGEARTLADEAVFGGWHPSKPATFAYATPEALYVATTGRDARQVIQVPPAGICPDCETGGAPPGEWGWGDWMGWSPDGRYIGLPDFAPVLAVIEVETGDLRILTGDVADEAFIFGARWLR